MLLSEITFASLLAYSPRGNDPVGRTSRTWTYRLKDEEHIGEHEQLATAFFADRLAHHVDAGAIPGWFGPNVTLVPVPGHAPHLPGSLWIAERLCARMVERGLGARTSLALERVRAVERSRTLLRPSPEAHLDSMRATATEPTPDRILVVDDVITRGAVGLAAVSLLKDRWPMNDIRLFTMIRTIRDPVDFRGMHDPCTGIVALQPNGSTLRRP